MVLEKLSKMPETRNYILHTLQPIYDTIDFELLEEVDLEELAAELPQLIPNFEEFKKPTNDEDYFDNEFQSNHLDFDLFFR